MIKVINNYFKIDTKNTTYLFKLNPIGMLETVYYGKKLLDAEDYSFIEEQAMYGGGVLTSDNSYSIYEDCSSLESATNKRGDYREPSIKLAFKDNDHEFFLKYKSHTLIHNHELKTLPCAYNREVTLAITLVDEVRQIEVTMFYSTYQNSDVITRSTSIKNLSNSMVRIDKIASFSFDILDDDYLLTTLNGAWAKERQINTSPLAMGITKVSSNYGFSSAQSNPFTMLKDKNATFTSGNAYGFNLIYSGNHMTTFERTMYHKIRIVCGINETSFSWNLNSGEVFESPEATLCFSPFGINNLTYEYHQFIKNHILRGEYKDKEKPILINNWEGTYFDFNEDKLLEIARLAKDVGIEMFVLDDGWFADRNSDKTSLGDWYPNYKKLPYGVKGLSEKIHNLGLKFGLWFEPEMVSPISELYKMHPEWAIKHHLYEPLLSRNQFVLDLTNDEVVNYVGSLVINIIKESNLDYVKWDCNRNIADYYSDKLLNQEEFLHRYIIGFYKLVKMVTENCPHVLFESCSAGGNRADLGLLCYMPQFWCSDNTDSVSRMYIQEGTLLCYPQCSMGSHVSSSPSHQTFRNTTIDNKFNVACIGAFGYELDLTKLTEHELIEIKDQISWYKKHRKLLQFGDFYQIKSIFADKTQQYEIVSPENDEAILFMESGLFMPYQNPVIINPIKLNSSLTYEVKVRKQYQNIFLQKGEFCEENCWTLSGTNLLNSGIRLPYEWLSGNGQDKRIMEDFGSRLYYIKKKEN